MAEGAWIEPSMEDGGECEECGNEYETLAYKCAACAKCRCKACMVHYGCSNCIGSYFCEPCDADHTHTA